MSWLFLRSLVCGNVYRICPRTRPLFYSMCCYLSALPAILAASFLIIAVKGGENPFYINLNLFSEHPDGALFFVPQLVFLLFFGPILEELIFRGALQGWLCRHRLFGPFRSIGLSSVVFAAFHAMVTWLPLLLLGLILGIIRFRTDKITMSIMVHAFHNFLVVLLLVVKDLL